MGAGLNLTTPLKSAKEMIMAKGQKKSNRETRKPKADKTQQKTISISSGEQMQSLMHPSKKK